ncbi:MAG: hypothetical protein HC882_04430, partial [Acidobacteria bacterium]|nr:hypothetical protein [Acidobacteriota bacterium]
MFDQADNYVPQTERYVELLDVTGDPITYTFTDRNGFYQLPAVENPDGFYVAVYSWVRYNRAGGNDLVNVHNVAKRSYSAETSVQLGVGDGSYSMGTWHVDNGDIFEGAFWAFNALQSTWRALYFIERDPAIFPGFIEAEWYPGSVEPTRYVRGDRIYLDSNDPLAPDIVSHEAGHQVMWNLYDGSWPISDCPSPHFNP